MLRCHHIWLIVGLCLPAALLLASADMVVDPPDAPREQRWDLNRLYWDLRPVWYMVGVWEANSKQSDGNFRSFLPFSDVIDFAIGILPMFGARSLNYTGFVYDQSGNVMFNERGFLLVTNKTRFNPKYISAFLTMNDRGYVMLEEGEVEDNQVTLSMQSFLVRSQDRNRFVTPAWFRRKFIVNGASMTQIIEYEMGGRLNQYTNAYHKIEGQSCFTGCQFIERWKSFPGACRTCF